MGVGPCEWSEVNTNAATKEGFVMNTLRRIPRLLTKAVAAGAVLVAAAVPMAIAGTAGAATAPTLTCLTALNPATYCPNYVVAGQGSSGTVNFAGTGFANDQAIGGNVTLTTTAAGVSFSNAQETSAIAGTATITTSSTTAPGFYPVTLTDDNGSVTMAVGLGIDVGPQVTAVTGNVTTTGGTTTVNITGTNLRTASASFAGTGTLPHVTSGYTINSLGTTMSFTVATSGPPATPGTFSMIISDSYPSLLRGQFVSSYTVNAAATPVTITGITPSELGIPGGPSSSNVAVTVSGTGFLPGAVVQICAAPGPCPAAASAGVTFVSSTFVNSSTMTFIANVAPGAAIAQDDVRVLNPDATQAEGTGILGIGEAAAAVGPAAPTPPVVTYLSGTLTPGTSSIIHVIGSSTFPITTSSTVKVTFGGLTNPSEILSGTVLSVDATNTATVRVIVPRFATTTLTTASTAGGGTLAVADATGVNGGSVTLVDGTSTQVVTYGGSTATSLTGIGAGLLVHAVGTLVEWPFPTTATAVAAVNNGTITEATAPLIPITAPIPYGPIFTSAATAKPVPRMATVRTEGTVTLSVAVLPLAPVTVPVTLSSLNVIVEPVAKPKPGTYAFNTYEPGWRLTTGAPVAALVKIGP